MLKNIKAKEIAKSKHAISNKMTDLQKIIRYLYIKSLYLLTTSKKGKEKANYKAYKVSSKQQKRGLDWKINELFNYKIMIESIEIIYL